jgi:hypothetical protein
VSVGALALSRLYVPRRLLLTAVFAALASALVLALTPAHARIVATPALLALTVLITAASVLSSPTGRAPLDEVGAWYMATVGVYLLWPLGVYFALGMEFPVLSDVRFATIQPTPAMTAEIAWYYTLHILGFVSAYLLVRSRRPASMPVAPIRVDRPTAISVAVLVVVVQLFFLFIGSFVNVSGDSTYAGGYVAVNELPVAVRQLWNAFGRLRWSVMFLALVLIFSNYRRWRLLLVAWIGTMALLQFVQGGARTPLFLLIAGAAILYHMRVRAVSTRTAAITGIIGLLAFQGLGIMRDRAASLMFGVSADAMPVQGFSLLGSASEFDALYANAMDLRLRDRLGEVHPPLAFHASDLLALVPSQLLPFEKVEPAFWYMATYYPEALERGSGFAFGVIAQSAVGFGMPEALLRGVLTGVLLGALQRLYRRRSGNLWVLASYLWVALLGYQMFRASSLYLLAPYVFGFVPVAVAVALGRAVLKAGFGRGGPARGSMSEDRGPITTVPASS